MLDNDFEPFSNFQQLFRQLMLDAELEEILMKMLDPEPSRRATAQELLQTDFSREGKLQGSQVVKEYIDVIFNIQKSVAGDA